MYFDVAMPLALFLVTVLAMFLNGKVEGKLKMVFEEREFRVRDAVLLVAAASITVSIIVFIPQMAIMGLFLFAYSMLLFIFTYLFSNIEKAKAKFLFATFSLVSIIASASLLGFGAEGAVAYGALAFFCLGSFSFVALLYEDSAKVNERWYMAVLPPATFLSLYLFFGNTPIWFPYMFNLYGVAFAVLIILYIGSLFTWKTSLVFAGLITVMDIILVLGTGAMVSAATHVSALRLPVMVFLPIFPSARLDAPYIALGLGDFFFAGIIAVQTFKKFGKNFAVRSTFAMATSFFVFEFLIFNYGLESFPGTLMIICGWLPMVMWKGRNELVQFVAEKLGKRFI